MEPTALAVVLVGPEGSGSSQGSLRVPTRGSTQPALEAQPPGGQRRAGRARGVSSSRSRARFQIPPLQGQAADPGAPRPSPPGRPAQPPPPRASSACARPSGGRWPRSHLPWAASAAPLRSPSPAPLAVRSQRGGSAAWSPGTPPAPPAGPRAPRPPPQPASRSPDISSSFSIWSANSRGSASSVPSGPRMPGAGGRGGGRPPSRRARCQP